MNNTENKNSESAHIRPVCHSADANPIYANKKTGKNYVFLMDAIVEDTGEPAIVYKSCETGKRFIRSANDFYDGRFEIVA